MAGDWRLPNIRELFSLIDYGTANPMYTRRASVHEREVGHLLDVYHARGRPDPRLDDDPGIAPTVFDLKINANRMWPVRRATLARGADRADRNAGTHRAS